MSRRVTETCHSEVTDLIHLNTKPKYGTDWAIQSFVKLTDILHSHHSYYKNANKFRKI